MTTQEIADRLERLETQFAFQEQLLASLDDIVAAQSGRITSMERDLASVRASLVAMREGGDGEPAVEPPPPHY